MRLTDEQIRRYDEDGFLVLHGILSPAEIAVLQADAAVLQTPERGHADANVYEKDGTTLRAAWAVEIDSEACRRAMRLPRILGPVLQLTGRDTYLYQSRLNYKMARSGDVFQWHQDYGSWIEDGVADGGHRRMLSVLIMLDDTTAESGPLRFIPGSHGAGLLRSEYDTATTSYALHCTPNADVERLLAGGTPFQCTGPAGTVVLFGGNLVHGSQRNRSDRDRRNLYFAYNTCDNLPDPDYPRRRHANGYIMSRDTAALAPVPDDALVDLANQRGLTGAPRAA